MDWVISPAAKLGKEQLLWDDLNIRTINTPLLDASVLMALLTEFGDGSEILAMKKNSKEASAAGIFVRKNLVTWQTFQPKNSPVGAWISQSPDNMRTQATQLLDALPGFNLVLGFSQLDPNFVERPSDNNDVSTLDYIDTPRIDVPGSFADYWQSRGKNLRHNIKRQTNRLVRDEVDVKLEILRNREDMAAAVGAYGEMELAGWKGSRDSAVTADNAQGRFYRQMLETLSLDREAVVLQFFFDSKLVASDLCVLRNGTLIILKTTYDETVESVSPAHLMRYEAFKKMFDSGEVGAVEFYGPTMDWHRRWTADIRTMYHLTFFRWSFLKNLRGAK